MEASRQLFEERMFFKSHRGRCWRLLGQSEPPYPSLGAAFPEALREGLWAISGRIQCTRCKEDFSWYLVFLLFLFCSY